MVELLTIVAVVLLVAGVVGSVLPAIPGPILSVAGVWVYWWSAPAGEMGLVLLAGFTLVGLIAVGVDLAAGAISAKAGGASRLSSVVAGIAGIVLFFFVGPLGVILGVSGSVFAVEYLRGDDARQSGKAAAYTAVGILGSAAVQALITVSMLVAFLLVLWV